MEMNRNCHQFIFNLNKLCLPHSGTSQCEYDIQANVLCTMLSAEGCILFPGNVVEWSRLSRAKDIHLCLDKLYLYQSPSVKNGEEKIQKLIDIHYGWGTFLAPYSTLPFITNQNGFRYRMVQGIK